MGSKEFLLQVIPSTLIAVSMVVNLVLFIRSGYKQTNFFRTNLQFKVMFEAHSAVLRALSSQNRFDTISMYKSLRRILCIGTEEQAVCANKCIAFYNQNRNHFNYADGEGSLVEILTILEDSIKKSTTAS